MFKGTYEYRIDAKGRVPVPPAFRRRLSETLDDAGEMRLLTDGKGLFLRTRHGHIFDLLIDPSQPLITGEGLSLVPVQGRARRRVRNRKSGGKSGAKTRDVKAR